MPGYAYADEEKEEFYPPGVDEEKGGQDGGYPHGAYRNDFRLQRDGFVYHEAFYHAAKEFVRHRFIV